MFLNSRRLFAVLLSLAFPLMLGACSKQSANMESQSSTPSGPVHVTAVDLGKSVDAESRITEKTDTFNPNDVIYATVLTDGAAPNTVLKATWTFQDDQVVSQAERVIAPTGPAATEFHIQKADGFPAGKYKVVVTLNGTPVQTKEFEVKAT